MKSLLLTIAAGAALSMFASLPVRAASFDCTEIEAKLPAERTICRSSSLGALDERLDSWYRRAQVRAGYFDQTDWLRGEQLDWLASRNACGASYFCLRRHYVSRIRTLKNYVEHV
jgi:uncharacterized protein